jgi:succinate-acetate transporter protein
VLIHTLPTLQLTRIYASATSYLYQTVRLSLTFFSVFCIVSLACSFDESRLLIKDFASYSQLFLLLTMANAIVCLANFGNGVSTEIPHFVI